MNFKFQIDVREFRDYQFEDQILRTNIFKEYEHCKNDDFSNNSEKSDGCKEYSLMNIFDDKLDLSNKIFKLIDNGEPKFYKVRFTEFENNMQTLKILQIINISS